MKKTNMLAAILLATGAMTTLSMAAETLTFTSFGGAFQDAQRQALLTPTEDALGITILEDTLTGIAEVRAQVSSGAVTWDIVDLGLADCAAAEHEGLLEPIDFGKVSVSGFAPKAFSKSWVGTIYFSTVLAYNQEVFPTEQPKTWADFFDVEKFPGRRSLQNDPVGTLEIALLADGVSREALYPLDLDRAFAKLEQIKPHVDVWWSSPSQSAQLIADNEVDLIAIWNGRLDDVIAGGAPVDFSFEEGIASLDCLAIPKGAPNKDLAMEALAIMLAPEQQAEMTKHINYGPTTALAFNLGVILPEAAANSPSSPDNLKVQAIQDANYWAANRQAIQERWNAFMN